MIRKVPLVPLFFSALGLIAVVGSITTNDLVGVIHGAFFAVCFFPDLLLVEHIKIRILHRFSVLILGVLGYYVSFSLLIGVIMLVAGAFGLIDAIHLTIRKDTIHLTRKKT
jgi:hypothetical protein